jgi:hypothetical protein
MSFEVTNGLFSFLPKRRTRSDNEFYSRVEIWKIKYLRNSFFYERIELWNQLPTILRLINSFKIFKRELCNLFIELFNFLLNILLFSFVIFAQ